MERALELAVNGAGNVSPNPMVGCVVTHKDQIIGEGWHQQYGQPHAEVNAINSVEDKSLLSESTVYVTLEPCNHYGITPPCTELLIVSKVKRVVICNTDPNSQVAGKGIEKLKSNNIQVFQSLLEDVGKKINRRFFIYHQQKRPYIILKWAETADGFIARENFDSKWISNEYSRQIVHRWRGKEDAIIVGKNTAQYDNPRLNVRDAFGKDPMRLVIDRSLNLSNELSLFDQKQFTICYNEKENSVVENLEFKKINFQYLINNILDDLFERKVLSVIVEGGTKTIQSFIDNNLWDEARIFKSEKRFEKGISSPQLSNSVLEETEEIMGDRLFIYSRNG